MNMIEKRKQMRGQGGFTLIELLVVVAILGILAGVVVFAVGNLTDDANENACKIELRTMKTAVEAYKADNNGNYPAQESDLLGTWIEDSPELVSVTYNGASTAPTYGSC